MFAVVLLFVSRSSESEDEDRLLLPSELVSVDGFVVIKVRVGDDKDVKDDNLRPWRRLRGVLGVIGR